MTNRELLSRGIQSRYTELTMMMLASPTGVPGQPRRARHVGADMPRHARLTPGKVRAYQPMPRY